MGKSVPLTVDREGGHSISSGLEDIHAMVKIAWPQSGEMADGWMKPKHRCFSG